MIHWDDSPSIDKLRAPGRYTCGTAATGWLAGGHPTKLYESIYSTSCFDWDNNCQWSDVTQVTNCGGYFVYKLNDVTACRLRYCAAHWNRTGLMCFYKQIFSTFRVSHPVRPSETVRSFSLISTFKNWPIEIKLSGIIPLVIRYLVKSEATL